MRCIKVRGSGQVSREPDVVTLSFDIATKAKDYAECLRLLDMCTEELRSNIEAVGIDRAELKTTSFAIRVETQYEDGKSKFVGYVASHNLQIELPAERDGLSRVLRAIAHGHSGAEIRIAFSVKDREGLRKLVLEDAVRTAKTNAASLAAAAGVKLGLLQQIDYGWTEVRIHDSDFDLLSAEATPTQGPDIDIQPEDVRAEDSVTLVYEIID